jgi:hypothetical protein
MDLAEVTRVTERPGDALPAVREALALYEQKGHVVAAGRARATLAEIEAGDLRRSRAPNDENVSGGSQASGPV